MKRFPPKTFTCGSISLWGIPLFFAAATPLAVAAPLQEARVSQVIQDVRLLEARGAPRPAVVNDKVTLERAVRTGKESRAELTFTDLTITRLGANTIFSLKAGAREVDLTSGTILLAVPSGAAPAKANTVGVTVSVMGGTALLATGPPTKFMVLEGIGTIYPKGHPEKAATVHGGEMVMMTADKKITQPEKFDVKLVLETSALIVDFPPLANLPLILTVMNQQLAEQQLAGTTSQTLARNLIDVIGVTDQNANSNPIVLVSTSGSSPTPPPPTATPPPPTPAPSKFGTPPTITSPNPYVITSGTVITTDPSITTNGVTNFGKIYRGSTDDGAFTLWAFGSTSAFDTALGIDDVFFADANHLPIAVLKFQSLSLTGNPTIDLSNGGGTKLGLIGVDGITSGPPGGILTFTGLDLLVLATVNGSINLTSDVSFQDLSELAMYARGAGSDLTLDSPISNVGILELAAEGSIQLTNPGTMSVGEFEATAGNNLTLQIGGSLLLDGKVRLNTLVLPGTTVATGANLTLNVTSDYTNSSTSESSKFSVINAGGNIGTGGNISFTTGGDFTANGDATFTIQNTTGSINNGGDIGLTVGGSIATPGVFSVLVENYDFSGNTPGHIGTGGNISVTTGGDLSAQSVVALLNNRSGGQIESPVSLTLSIGGALTTSGDSTDPFGFPTSLFVIISSRFDSTSGPALASTIGGDATLTINADSASIGGNVSTDVSNSGSTLNGNALLSLGITHDVSIQGEADIQILNDADSASPLGGMLHGSATLQVGSNNFTANALFAQLDNRDGGVIDSNATLAFNLTGSFAIPGTNPGNPDFDATVPGEADIFIENQKRAISQDSATSGGTIGGNALIQLGAASASTAGALDVEINNFSNGVGSTGGSIGGDATISLNIAGGLTTQSNAFFNIANQNNGGTNGGMIGGNATVNVTAANISTGLDSFGSSLDGLINNATGNIGGDAIVNVGVTGAITAQGPANFQILNNDGGHIGGNANIFVATGDGSDLTANSVLAFVNNHNAGSIASGSNITFNIGGSLTTTGDATFGISNLNDGNGGGTIGSLTTVDLNAASISVGGFFQTFVSTNGGGIIHGDAINTVIATGDLTAQQGILLSIPDTIFGSTGNFTGGHIDGNAIVTLTAQNITTPSTNSGIPGTDVMAIEASIYPNASGTVGGDAIVNVSASQNISAPGSILFWVANGNYLDLGGGTIGGNATVNVSAASLSSGDLFVQILNYGGASIGSDAAINVTADTLSVGGSLNSTIDNSTGGTIGGNAAINMNVSGSATVTNDATFQILGSDGAASAAINFNGGSYDAGGTFLAYIDGDGTITFNNASAHADVLKVGALGTNGVLNIGGGMLSADTTLELYASGSNGQLNFVSNVTLGGNSTKILAANSVTIFNNIVVTIGGSTPAQVYTNNANYTGFGGNGTTTGTFAGAGANNPLPLNQAPPFGPATRTVRNGGTFNVNNTAELLALLDGAAVGPDGRITIPDSKSATTRRDANQTSINRLSRLEHQLAIQRIRDRGVTRVGGGKLAAAQ